jgi:hypothetical protein
VVVNLMRMVGNGGEGKQRKNLIACFKRNFGRRALVALHAHDPNS